MIRSDRIRSEPHTKAESQTSAYLWTSLLRLGCFPADSGRTGCACGGPLALGQHLESELTRILTAQPILSHTNLQTPAASSLRPFRYRIFILTLLFAALPERGYDKLKPPEI